MEAEDAGGEGEAMDNEGEEEPLVPDEITDDYFEGLCTKIQGIIKDLQSEQKYTLAEEFQRVIGVSQKLKENLGEEQNKIEQMKEEIAAATGRVAAAVRLSQTDNETINRLKIEINGAWKQSDIARTREHAAQETMIMLRQKLEKLQIDHDKLTDKKDAADADVSAAVTKQKEGIQKEAERLKAELDEYKSRLAIQRAYTEEVEKKRSETEQKLKEMYKVLDQTSDEAFKEKKMLELVKVQLTETTEDRDLKEAEAKHYKIQADVHYKTTVTLNGNLQMQKAAYDKLIIQYRGQTDKVTRLQADMESMIQFKEKLVHELSQSSNMLKLREDENNKYRLESTTMLKRSEMLMKKLMKVASQKSMLEQDVLKYQAQIVTFEKEQDATKRAFDNMRKEVDKVGRDRDLVRKDLMKSNRIISEHLDTILLHEQHIKTLDNDIRSHLQLEHKLRATITKIEKERDRNAEEIQVLADKVESLNEDLTAKINQITELKESILELQTKMAHVQLLFETARSERNAFQRDLQACVEDRDDLKDRLRIATRQTEQLKEDIATKEAELLRAEKAIDKLEKEKQALKIENQNILVALQHTKTELKEKKIENERLYKTLTDDELRLTKLRADLDTALNEKDLIGTQMIRRNDEIGLLNEKLHIIQMALDRGESQYNKRLDDIRLLKIEIANLRSQRNLLTRGLANTADMRQEVLQLHRILTQERVKARALEQEMTTPMNIHRWRKLEGKDPDKLDLITKVQVLQKRLLSQTVQATNREKALQDTHKLYTSLKEYIVRLPTYEVKERLTVTQRILTAKTKKLKALTAELNAKEIDEKTKECQIDELKSSLLDTKRELIKQRKEKLKIIEDQEIAALNNMTACQNVQSGLGYRTLGSGFKVPT